MSWKKRNLHKQERAPIPEAMRAYAEDGALAFHTPGHKQGRGAHALLQELITAQGLREEVSLMEELDDLHAPTMCIKEAQELAAALYGADASYFMINGTTGAVHVMLMAALSPGDTVLVPRNVHRSILGGIILSGARPVFIQPEISEELGIAMGLPLSAIRLAVQQHPEAKALVMVYPTYYGVTVDLRAVAALVHAQGMLLLVDEAHGPHLCFHEALPPSAMECGADMAAQSTHKILGSLTQTSMLHVRYGRLDSERVRNAASLLQSTSPNYLLLASLDIARLQMAADGKRLIGRAVALAEKLRAAINRIDGLWCFGRDDLRSPGADGLDVTKLTVQVRGLGISGAEAEYILRHEYKIQCELADAYNVLFILSFADTEQETAVLLTALQALAAHHRGRGRFTSPVRLPDIPPLGIDPRKAFFSQAAAMEFASAAGCVAAEMVTFYPPGIPVLCPGEEITTDVIAYVQAMQQIGLRVVGPQDVSLQTIRVIKAMRT